MFANDKVSSAQVKINVLQGQQLSCYMTLKNNLKITTNNYIVRVLVTIDKVTIR
jgi:hypothetical protein